MQTEMRARESVVSSMLTNIPLSKRTSAGSSKLFYSIIPQIHPSNLLDSADGFNVGAENQADGIIKTVTAETGDSGAGKPYIADATGVYKKFEGTQGFKVRTVADAGTIMVSGTNVGISSLKRTKDRCQRTVGHSILKPTH
jgi:hypothetical protein